MTLESEILDNNPHIDRQRLEESREMLKRLRKNGVKPAGYNLGRPGDHRARIGQTAGQEARNLRGR